MHPCVSGSCPDRDIIEHIPQDAKGLNLNANPPLYLLATFQRYFPDTQPQWIIQAPGREMWVAAGPGREAHFVLTRVEPEGKTTFSWQSAKRKLTVLKRPLPTWARYPAGVVLNLCAAGLDVSGLNMTLMGAESSGPRVEYSMGMALAALLHEIHEYPYTADSLLEVVERVRREYIESAI